MKNLLLVVSICFSMTLVGQKTAPSLKNFRIENSQKAKVYFDSSIPIKGSSISGFIIDGKKITSMFINSGKTSGHYISLSSSFNYWDSALIRYKGGSNIKNLDGIDLGPFNLQYIRNKISEPRSKGNIYYVSREGNNNSTGLSEAKSWRTIAYAATKARAGDVVYIKAGSYGGENIVVKNTGTVSNPIKFIGYKRSIGDNPSLRRSTNMSFASSEMPLLSKGGGTAISITAESFIIVRNIQIENYSNWGIDLNNSEYIVMDNIYVRGMDIGIRTVDEFSTHNRIINSFIANCKSSAIRLDNNYNLIENVWAVSSKSVDMDYYITIRGGNSGIGNIVRNCYVERYAGDSHPGHGISLKGGNPKYKIQHSLIENNEIVNCGGALEFRHNGVKYNVARNIKIRETRAGQSSGIKFREAASYNIVENSDLSGEVGVRFENNKGEDLGDQIGGSYNKIINTVFHDLDYAVFVKNGLRGNKGNEFINCTFFNVKNLYSQTSGSTDNKFNYTNKFVNCALDAVSKKVLYGKPSFVMEHSNFWNYWGKDGSSEVGKGNISVASKFLNSGSRNFKLDASSKLIDAGKITSSAPLDCDGNSRPQGTSHDIGAFEFLKGTVSSPDDSEAPPAASEPTRTTIEICKGESVTLTAPNGGDKYRWSTGENTQSIKVSPTVATLYVVRVTTNDVIVRHKYDVVIVSSCENNTDEEPDSEAPAATNEPTRTTVQICKGESVTLTAPNGGDKYRWSTGEMTQSIKVSPTVETLYVARVITNDIVVRHKFDVVIVARCGDTTTSNPEEPNAGGGECTENISAYAGKDVTIKAGERIQLTASGGGNYLWSNGATTSSIKVSPNKTKKFTVTVFKNGCEDTDEVIVNVIVSKLGSTKIASEKEFEQQNNIYNNQLSIFPNPSSDVLNVNFDFNYKNKLNLILIDQTGKIVLRDHIFRSYRDRVLLKLDVSRYPVGIYYLRLFNENENISKTILVN